MRALVGVLVVLAVLCAGLGGVSGARRGGGGGDSSVPVDPMDGKWKTVTFYELLGLDRANWRSLKLSEVMRAYRDAAQLHHPDKFADRSRYSAEAHREAEKRFARLVDAMKTLRSRETRENYDELLQHGKVDYSDVDWEAWNYAKYQAYQKYVEDYNHEEYERAEADLQLWLGGGATVIGLGVCGWWIYGDQIRRYMRDRERKAKRREDRERAGATAVDASVRGRHRSDKRVRPANGSASPASPTSPTSPTSA